MSKISILSSYNNGIAIYGENYKCGLITQKGKVILNAQYIGIEFKNAWNCYVLTTYDGYVGIADMWGKVIISPNFINITCLHNLFLCENEKRQHQAYSSEGLFLFDYDEIEVAKERSLSTYIINIVDSNFEQRYFLMNDRGDIILDSNNTFIENIILYKKPYTLIVIESRNFCSVFDSAFRPIFENIESFSIIHNHQLFLIKREGLYYIYDLHGKQMLDRAYEYIECTNDALVVKDNGLYGIITLYNEVLTKPRFCQITPISNGNFLFCKGELYGILNHTGKIQLDANYVNIIELDKGYLVRTIDNNIQLLNSKYKLLVSFYDNDNLIENIYPIGDYYIISTAKAYNCEGTLGVVDKKGNQIISCVYDNIEILGDFFKVTIEGEPSFSCNPNYPLDANRRQGIIDTSGNEVVKCKYYSIKLTDDGFKCKSRWNSDEYEFMEFHQGISKTIGWGLDSQFVRWNNHRQAYTHGKFGTCPYCGHKECNTYADGSAVCNRCGQEFRYH